MASFESRYCALIILDLYGEVVHKVAQAILQYGKLPLFRIIQDTQLPKDEVIAALLILFQHSFLRRDPENNEAPSSNLDGAGFAPLPSSKPKLINYEVNTQSVLRRARAAKYLRIAQEMFGSEGHAIVSQIVLRGILPYNKLIDGALEHLQQQQQQVQVQEASGVSGYKLEHVFRQMCSRKFIRQVHPVEHFSIIKDPIRFSFDAPPDFLYLDPTSVSSQFSATGKRLRDDDIASGASHVAKYRIDDAREAVISVDDPNHTFWVLHADRFHLHVRNQLLVEFCSRRYLRYASDIVSSLLTASENDDDLDGELSSYVQDTTLSFKRETPDVEKQLRKYAVEDLFSESVLVKNMGMSSIAVNVKLLSFLLLKETVEQIISERYGTTSTRLFRILFEKGFLDQKQLQDYGMIPLKDARERANTLLTNNLVALQELPKSSERVASRTAFAWTVKVPQIVDLLRKEVFRILGNLKARHEAERGLVTPNLNGIRRLDVAEFRLDDILLLLTNFDETRLPLDLPDAGKKPRGRK